MKNVKKFYTQRAKRWKLIDRLAFVIPVLIFLYLSFGNAFGRELYMTIVTEGDAPAFIAATVLLLLMAVIASLPLFLIWRAVSRSIRKSTIKKASFKVTEDLDYYREKLTGLSPTAISLLMDLKIEEKKDIAALVLKYTQMKAVAMHNGTVEILNYEHPDLKPSDKNLLQMIAYHQFTPEGLNNWKKLAEREAMEEGYITSLYGGGKQVAGRSCFMGGVGGCLVPLILLMVLVPLISLVLDLDGIDSFLEAAPEDLTAYGQISYLLASPEMLTSIGFMIILAIVAIVILLMPIVSVVAFTVSAGSSGLIRRTEEGELASEQIAGMKNFIRDFSNLSNAEKEQLIVWDDFLVYAVVLEENERVIEEVFQMRNFDLRAFRVL